jgi:hypothetical protein
MLLEFNAADLSSIVETRVAPAPDLAASRSVRKARLATSPTNSRIRARPASSPAVPGPSILRVRALLRPALVVLALVPALEHGLVSARLVPEALALPAVQRRRPARLRAPRVRQVRREAVGVSSIPKPKKAR